ncbi:Phosphatidyl-N-methylethanolamine N-methyltransferase [Lobosporangium transversale]|uniref:Phosphatidyl-N-methylethanolamine N-methyltransferase n=1 Tax=Lobosporangium transversale TaxID=64571 RepID=A0A1Y2GB72_9FUNG|nr:phosphatidylethanolamine N-methyltransferase [Lobosporangium transversale]KAF9909172.1 Phosphatidyl-N-methylethanolamine N-methyltransferase [Lobosporangium transversale]ORZ05973.1 phosphatidylethanolamine N-methyltransferase [Lobosporangium transversale]|eukprot:XP_021877354.1 phosphatidylethanolamine N-methyltransferase [Lobosporangium transversale]
MDIRQCYNDSRLRVDWSDKRMWFSVASIIFNPTFWNIVARKEYRSKFITRLFNGNSLYGCYALAATIFTLGLIRDAIFKHAIDNQPKAECMNILPIQVLAWLCLIVGNLFVLSSMWVLGVTGTYLGDYFGILMDERVTSFPFNVNNNPMYNGTVMIFLGTALWSLSPAGIYLTCIVHFVYRIALKFEGPFTTMIYNKRDQERSAAKAPSAPKNVKKNAKSGTKKEL